jgi:hypothetical protein
LWQRRRTDALDELETAHTAVGGTGPGRRYATAQLNRASVIAVASQFQGFCRDLHTEVSDFVASQVTPPALQTVVFGALTQGRRLDRGNANLESISADFGRFGIEIWDAVRTRHRRNVGRRTRLEQLNIWRNAIAHDDLTFSQQQEQIIGGTKPILKFVRVWRNACGRLAVELDDTIADHLLTMVGARPWQ